MRCKICGGKMALVVVWMPPRTGFAVSGYVCSCGHHVEVRQQIATKKQAIVPHPMLTLDVGASPVHSAISKALTTFGK